MGVFLASTPTRVVYSYLEIVLQQIKVSSLNEFSLEALKESIYNHKTMDYFEEIISSYNNKSFRSATVMLWSVAVSRAFLVRYAGVWFR